MGLDLVATKADIGVLIRAKYALIAFETFEETRAEKIIKDICDEQKRSVYTWSISEGLRDKDGNPVGNDQAPTGIPGMPGVPQNPVQALTQIDKMDIAQSPGNVYILYDFHRFLDQPMVQRKLRDMFLSLKETRKNVIFISPKFPIPADLQKAITMVDLPLPDAHELEEILCNAIRGLQEQENRIGAKAKSETSDEKKGQLKEKLKKVIEKRKKLTDEANTQKDRIVRTGLGLTCDEFENVIAKCIIRGKLDINTILEEKKQIIKKSGLLEYFDTKETSDNIGGLKVLKKEIRSLSKRFSQKSKDFGLDPPRGLLLLGLPGGGKSLTAKACSNELQLPLLRLDMSQLVSKFYGESSNNMRNVWKLANAIQPCILWVDEIEKGLGAGQNGEMHEESARLFGSFLTEMEESEGVFVIATCNDHVSLKAELQSRFPKIFFINAPSPKERKEIFEIHLRHIKRDPKTFDIDKLAESSAGFVGREIRNVIQDGLGIAFDEDKPLNTDHIITALSKVKPITVQKKEKLDEMIRWASENAINASEEKLNVPVRSKPAQSSITERIANQDADSQIDDLIGTDDNTA